MPVLENKHMRKAILALSMLVIFSCSAAKEPEMLKGFIGTWYGRVNIEPAKKDWTIATFKSDVRKDSKGHSFNFTVVSLEGYSVINHDYSVQINPAPSGKKCIISLSNDGQKLFDAVETEYSDANGFAGEKKVTSEKGTSTQSVSLQKNKDADLELRFNLSDAGGSLLRIIISLSKKKLVL